MDFSFFIQHPDRWAPRYLAIADSLVDYTDLDAGFTVKISDLGAGKLSRMFDRKRFNANSACKSNNVSKDPVTPVGLRAPELILKTPFDHNIDIWSFGCLLYYFLTGMPLFPVDNGGQKLDDCDDDHFLQMTDYLGPLPQHMISQWSRSSKYFRDNGELFNTMISGPPGINRFGPVEELFKQNKSDEISEEKEHLVLDLLRSVLRYEPKERPSAEDILKHPWFEPQRKRENEKIGVSWWTQARRLYEMGTKFGLSIKRVLPYPFWFWNPQRLPTFFRSFLFSLTHTGKTAALDEGAREKQ